MRDRDRISHRRAAQRNERHDVEASDPRVHAKMPPDVDALDGHASQRQRGALDVAGVAEEGEDGPMVVRIAMDIGEFGASRTDRIGEGIDDIGSRPSLTFGTHSSTGLSLRASVRS
jgi:hypothetical protein